MREPVLVLGDVGARAAPSSVASAASRSVSWPRMCAMPRRCDGESASAQSAATAGVSSPTSCRSRSMPGQPSRSGARCRPSSSSVTSRPSRRGSRAARRRPGWSRAASRRTVTEPPVTTASGEERARRWRGRARSSTSTARTGPGATAQRLASRVVDLDAVLAQHRDRHLDVGERRHRLAVVAHVDALVVARARRAAAPRRTGDDARRVDRRPCRRGTAPGAVHGERQRAAAAVVDPDAERAQRVEHLADRARSRSAGRRRRRPARRPAPATGGTKRITVPARPQSTSASPVAGGRA